MLKVGDKFIAQRDRGFISPMQPYIGTVLTVSGIVGGGGVYHVLENNYGWIADAQKPYVPALHPVELKHDSGISLYFALMVDEDGDVICVETDKDGVRLTEDGVSFNTLPIYSNDDLSDFDGAPKQRTFKRGDRMTIDGLAYTLTCVPPVNGEYKMLLVADCGIYFHDWFTPKNQYAVTKDELDEHIGQDWTPAE